MRPRVKGLIFEYEFWCLRVGVGVDFFHDFPNLLGHFLKIRLGSVEW